MSSIVSKSDLAFRKYANVPFSNRNIVIQAIKETISPLVCKLAEKEVYETGMGVVSDKSENLMLALCKTPGIETLAPLASTDDDGIILNDYLAYGVICAITPASNACATAINNIIGMLSSGNSVIIAPHPNAINVTHMLVSMVNQAIVSVTGISDLVSVLPQTSMKFVTEIMTHPLVAMVVATGGARIVKKALSSGKKAICAGGANPVAMVDETANLSHAAKCIVDGASFNNNISSVSEKSIVVVSEAADTLIEKMKAQGAFYINDSSEMLKLTRTAINNNFMPNRSIEGKSAMDILRTAEIPFERDIRLIVVETPRTHPFVMSEMMMPLIPLIRVNNFDDMLETALVIEQGHGHTATIHSQNIARLNRAAQVMQTSIFVRNGSSLSGLGFNGGSAPGFTIANVTGEGVTTAKDFARRRRYSLKTGMPD